MRLHSLPKSLLSKATDLSGLVFCLPVVFVVVLCCLISGSKKCLQKTDCCDCSKVASITYFTHITFCKTIFVMILALVAFVATAINNMQFKIYNSDAIYKNHNF